MWRGSTGVKRCGVALTSATTPAPVRNLLPSWVVSLSVATLFHTTSVGGTVSRCVCVSLWYLRGYRKIGKVHCICQAYSTFVTVAFNGSLCFAKVMNVAFMC